MNEDDLVGGSSEGLGRVLGGMGVATVICAQGLGERGRPGGEEGLGMFGRQTLNHMIGDTQRELLKDLFTSGKAPQGLSRQTLKIYKELAVRAIESGADKLGVQAQRLELINKALSSIK